MRPIGLASKSAVTSISAGQEPVWWAWLDLNQRPHPYQQNAGNRCANGRFCRSRSTVEAEVTYVLSSPAAVSPRLNASFSFLRIDVMQYTAIYLLLCSMPRYLDTFASNPQGPCSAICRLCRLLCSPVRAWFRRSQVLG